MELSKKAKEALTGSVVTQVAVKLGVSQGTIYLWLKKNSPMLTTISCIEAVNEITGISENEMFVRDKQTASKKATSER